MGLFNSFTGGVEGEWLLQKKEKDILVYTRSRPGTSIKEVRVVHQVKSSLSGMVALLLDSPSYTQWIYACTESKPLKIVSPMEMFNYQVTDFPWPVSDRDLICNFTVAQDSVTKVVSFLKRGIPGYLPEKSDYVRIRDFQSHYLLTPVGKDSVKVELEMKVDPGGEIPTWLINSNIVMAPYKSTVAMLPFVAKYQSVPVPFIRNQ